MTGGWRPLGWIPGGPAGLFSLLQDVFATQEVKRRLLHLGCLCRRKRRSAQRCRRVKLTRRAHCLAPAARAAFPLGPRLINHLCGSHSPDTMRGFDVPAPPATRLKAAVKHTINLPAANSSPLLENTRPQPGFIKPEQKGCA